MTDSMNFSFTFILLLFVTFVICPCICQLFLFFSTLFFHIYGIIERLLYQDSVLSSRTKKCEVLEWQLCFLHFERSFFHFWFVLICSKRKDGCAESSVEAILQLFLSWKSGAEKNVSYKCSLTINSSVFLHFTMPKLQVESNEKERIICDECIASIPGK